MAKVKLENVRLAFPELFTAKAVNGEGTPAFSATLIMAPDHPGVQAVKDAMAQVAKEKWGEKAAGVYASLKENAKLCLRNGDARAEYAGFKGNVFVSARNKTRPLVIGADMSPLSAEDGRPYGGCYVNAVLDVWAQDNQYGKRVNATLAGVQFVKDGDRFSGGGAASVDDFAPLEGAEKKQTAASVFD